MSSPNDEDGPDQPPIEELVPDPDDPIDGTDPHVLAPEDLTYDTIELDGSVSPTDGIDATQDLDRETATEWLAALENGVTTHDLAIEGDDRRVTFGMAPDDVEVGFDPDEEHLGTLSVTFNFKAKALRYDPADERPVGARGGRGFIPIEMLTTDQDPADFRCYNWIEDPALEGDELDAGDDDQAD